MDTYWRHRKMLLKLGNRPLIHLVGLTSHYVTQREKIAENTAYACVLLSAHPDTHSTKGKKGRFPGYVRPSEWCNMIYTGLRIYTTARLRSFQIFLGLRGVIYPFKNSSVLTHLKTACGHFC